VYIYYETQLHTCVFLTTLVYIAMCTVTQHVNPLTPTVAIWVQL